MKCFCLTTSILTLATTILAQDIRQLPQCAQGPVLDAISATGCPLTDIACICANKGFIPGLLVKLPTVCTQAEVDASGSFAVKLCGATGVVVSVPAASSSSPAVSSPTSSGNSTTQVVAATKTESKSTTSPTSTAVPNSGTVSCFRIGGIVLGAVFACIAAL